ncbi:MAG: hypothetical protein ACREN5_08715, partial [Gemmatimonadales bacterium]
MNENGVRVVGYATASSLCLAALVVEARRKGSSRRLQASWLSLAMLMGLLGLARVVDFGPWLTSVGRHRAQIEGWYDARRDIQFWA